MSYVLVVSPAAPRSPTSPRCIFCAIVAGDADASVVYADDAVMVFLDIYPMRPGHALVIPRDHAGYLAEVPAAVRSRLLETTSNVATAMRRSPVPCEDVNIVLNDGPRANQTVPHVHVHVIPRVRRDLPRLLRMLAQRPIQAALGGPRREVLDDQARAIAGCL